MDFSDTNILVFGDLMLDIYDYGDVTRISPEAPVPIIKIHKSENRLGGACNVAANIVSLGGKALLTGLIGDDDNGKTLKILLRDNKIKNNLIKSKNIPTTTKKRIVSKNQHILRIDSEKRVGKQDFIKLEKLLISKSSLFNTIVFSDYNKGANYDIKSLINQIKTNKNKIIVDPKHNDISVYQGIDYLTPNKKELEKYIGKWNSDFELETKVFKLMVDNKIGNILFTKSEKGVSLFSIKDGKLKHSKSKINIVNVFDVSGAGDSVVAILSMLVSLGICVSSQLDLINRVGSVSVSNFGTYLVKNTDIWN